MELHLEQILTQIVAFLLMYLILKKFAWKPLLSIMEERRTKLISEFDLIDQQKNDLKGLTEDYQAKMQKIDELSHQKIQEGIGTGNKLAKEIQEKAHEEAKKILERAKSEIKQEVEKGRSQLKTELVEIASAMTEKIIHEKIDEKKQKELLTSFVKRTD